MAATSPFPIFYPSWHPWPHVHHRVWLWFDPELSPADVGDFDSKAEAAADWSEQALLQLLVEEREAIDAALAMPLLREAWQSPPTPALAAEQAVWAAALEAAITQADTFIEAADQLQTDRLALAS